MNPLQISDEQSGVAEKEALGLMDRDGALLKSKKGIDISSIKKIGRGLRGIAYSVGTGKVLKITSDRREAIASQRLMGKDTKHVVKIFDVWKFKDSKIYGILQEQLEDLSPSDKKELSTIDGMIGGLQNRFARSDGTWPTVSADIKLHITRLLQKNSHLNLDAPGAVKSVFDVLENKFKIPEMVAELESHGIKFRDYHSENIMKRGNDYVVIDIGFSDVNGGELPPVLEKKVEEGGYSSDYRLADQTDRVLTLNSDRLKKYGLDPGKFTVIGKGTNGTAYKTPDARVFKVTQDRSEARASNHIKGKSFKHIVRIDDVFAFPESNEHKKAYGILQEMLQPLDSKEKDAILDISEYAGWRHDNDVSNYELMVKDIANLERIKQMKPGKAEDLYQAMDLINLKSIANDLKTSGIEFRDFHQGNVMKRGQDFVILDLGYSKSPGSDPRVLERKNVSEKTVTRDNRKLSEGQADTVVVTIGSFHPFHRGHGAVVRKMANRYSKVVLIVTNEPRDKNHPFSYELRHEIIKNSLLDISGKVEVYRAESGTHPTGFFPEIIEGIMTDHKSAIDPDVAVNVVVGTDRFDAVRDQIDSVRGNREDDYIEESEDEAQLFDPDLFVVQKTSEMKTDDEVGGVNGFEVRDAVREGNKTLLEDLMDPHLVGVPDVMTDLFEKMEKELKTSSKIKKESRLVEKDVEVDLPDRSSRFDDIDSRLSNAMMQNAEALAKKGIDPNELEMLGSGMNGVAYAMPDGRVFKATVDVSEAKASFAIQGKKLENVVRIFDVFSFRNSGKKPVYGIIQERLEKLSDAERHEFDKFSIAMVANCEKDSIMKGDFNAISKEYAAKHPDQARKFVIMATKYQIPKMMRDLQSAGIQFADYHGENVMRRGKNYVLIDLGVSIVAGALPPVMEDFKHIEKDLDTIFKTYSQKLLARRPFSVNVQNLTPLGHGQKGMAYDMGQGKVLKITTDQHEAKASNLLRGKSSLPNVIKIFDVFKFPDQFGGGYVYGIISEKLEPLDDAEAEEFDTLIADIIRDPKVIDVTATGTFEQLVSKIKQAKYSDAAEEVGLDGNASIEDIKAMMTPSNRLRRVMQNVELSISKTEQALIKFQMDKIYDQLRSMGIQFADFKAENMLKRGNDYVVNDLGASKSNGAEPPVLESLIASIIKEMMTGPTTSSRMAPGSRQQDSPWSSPGQVMQPRDDEKDEELDGRTFDKAP